ncbi:hypothetical protein HanXRQr2_Chr11g0506321 [Helianthus annuus]|uniref:Uncharacterized protein n=1 Tax=Helianthus annuus TaxID=4232 RepID=A0A9K3HRS0_HELAN|nr:hypothetical protein HanXRQr2_Chr11g0506321 [Helianthus annuus]KAJ0876393.1 hypothetical protein HanPSC8_Chr11g0487891 [Helianthus annuus]
MCFQVHILVDEFILKHFVMGFQLYFSAIPLTRITNYKSKHKLIDIRKGCAYWHTNVPIGTPNPSKTRVYIRSCVLTYTMRI